ncbi:MAG: alpha-L-arabinofuranosidase, partial [Lachnospiraceae bacterium]|nr:alpha-L-arabinofuranosidase [Lachnospiraceae bacterium]
MELRIRNEKAVDIHPDMIGLFFEDINYAADGGLYAEMIENRSFEFVEAFGDKDDYYTVEDGLYGWSAYPEEKAGDLKVVTGSPLSTENPHYLRFTAKEKNGGFTNKAYDGICLKKDLEYKVVFFARTRHYNGNIYVNVRKQGVTYASTSVDTELFVSETANFWRKYELRLKAKETVSGGQFVMELSEPGMVEFDFISMMPADAVAGVFRKDIFEIVKDMHPGFIRFPGGCIVEGDTLENRYRFKNTLHDPWDRKNNWNRWAVHGNCPENDFHSIYAHYNQTLGLGFYEYFLLCEMVGAKPLPVLNVGFACQYQSTEQVAIDAPEFQEFLQDALDLIEFANGDTDTYWGGIRAKMGHPQPFGLTMMGIGNEQWQTERADFFERYQLFEQTIHKADPSMKLIGSAGPDITSERYTAAWDFYRQHKDEKGFAYAIDEHYYVKPQWLLDHTHFYDDYDRTIKVFAGEYAAHPICA